MKAKDSRILSQGFPESFFNFRKHRIQGFDDDFGVLVKFQINRVPFVFVADDGAFQGFRDQGNREPIFSYINHGKADSIQGNPSFWNEETGPFRVTGNFQVKIVLRLQDFTDFSGDIDVSGNLMPANLVFKF